MNSSLLSADVGTHLKIVIVALLAGIAVMGISIGTRIHAGKPLSPSPRFEMPIPQPVAPVNASGEAKGMV